MGLFSYVGGEGGYGLIGPDVNHPLGALTIEMASSTFGDVKLLVCN